MKEGKQDQIKQMLPQVLYLLVLIVMFYVLLKSGSGNYFKQRDLLKQSRKTENMLAEKLAYLSEIGSVIRTDVETVTTALPEKNPVLGVIAQVKGVQGESGLEVSNIRVDSPSQMSSTRAGTTVKFDVVGDMEGIVGLLEKLMNILPITIINQVVITNKGSDLLAEIKATIFWQDLPTRIPPTADPVDKLSKDDLALLAHLQQMKMPGFGKTLPQPPSDRLNPF